MKVELAADHIAWTYRHHRVRIRRVGAEVALVDPGAERIVVLARPPTPGELLVFALTGEKLVTVSCPTGFALSYLVHHPVYGLSVVCLGAAKVDGWMDWHFSVDLVSGTLTRRGPAY